MCISGSMHGIVAQAYIRDVSTYSTTFEWTHARANN